MRRRRNGVCVCTRVRHAPTFPSLHDREWRPFHNSAREDGAQFHHWVRALAEFPDYPFARYNKQVMVPTYTDEEYARLAPAGDWTREQTDLLFDLIRRFDLRWPLVHDRFDMQPARTMEQLKARYYYVTKHVLLARGNRADGSGSYADQVLSFNYDEEYEVRRKHILHRHFVRTAQEEQEERELIAEQKALDVQLRRLQKEAKKARSKVPAAAAAAAPLTCTLDVAHHAG